MSSARGSVAGENSGGQGWPAAAPSGAPEVHGKITVLGALDDKFRRATNKTIEHRMNTRIRVCLVLITRGTIRQCPNCQWTSASRSQPLVNLHTGGVVAMEMLARPAHSDVRSLLCSAARAAELERFDVTLAVAAA